MTTVTGVFQQYRPSGRGVEAVFAGMPDGDRLLERLWPVYRATGGPECAADLYFVVRRPCTTTHGELRALGDEFLGNLKVFAESLHLAEVGQLLASAEPVVRSKSQGMAEGEEHALLCESLDDAMISAGRLAPSADALRDAYFSIACDQWLAYCLMWPAYRMPVQRDVFAPYFQLWLRGARCVLNDGAFRVYGPV